MSQLKPSFVRDVRETLEKSKFTSDDFDIELPKSGRVLIKVTFLHKPEYQFVLLEDEKNEQVTIKQEFLMSSRTERVRQVVYTVRCVPGQYKLDSAEEVSHPGDSLEAMRNWCDNIRADLYALAPVQDPLEQLRQKLKANLDEMVKDPEGYFTEDELTAVDTRFNQLFAEVSALREQYSLTKQQLSEFQKELDEFKGSARAYPKGVWAKVTSNKLVKGTGKMFNTPEGRKFLFDQVRRVLGLSDDA